MCKRILIVIFFLCTILAMKHPIHVSVTNIEYIKDKKALEISVKMFQTDLESALEIKNKKKIDLNNSSAENEKYNTTVIKNYFSEHFSLEINNNKIKIANFEFVQKKINNESVWLYFKIPFEKKINLLKIQYSILTDLFSDQTNLLIVTLDGVQKGYNLNNKETSAVLKL